MGIFDENDRRDEYQYRWEQGKPPGRLPTENREQHRARLRRERREKAARQSAETMPLEYFVGKQQAG